MAQVNVAYDDALLAHLDAVAERRGLSRPDLLRAIAEETVRADEQGRAMFEPPELPIDPDTAVVLATKVEQISIDLDRILRAAERREHKMLTAFNATEEANRNAVDRLGRDPVRWTANDHDRGLANSDVARVESVDKNGVSVSTRDGEVIDLKRGDPMLERLDLAYAVNAHIAQGMTARDGIMVLSENEKMLNSARGFLVAATRFTGEATLIVDNARNIERAVGRNAGDKTSAVEIAHGDRKSPEHYPGFAEDLKKLAETLGPEFAHAVLTDKERDIVVEKPLVRADGRRSQGDRSQDRSVERDLERER